MPRSQRHRWIGTRSHRSSVKDQAIRLERLENRTLLSAAFDVVGITALRADTAYSGVDGSNIGVAVIDTGLYSTHPDLAPNFAAWYDAVRRTSSNAPFDPNGHGSHVAGTAAARNPEIGVATQARLIGIRGLPDDNEAQPSHDTVLESLRWVINNYQTYNIRVINMSLGSPSNLNGNLPSSQYQPFFAELERLGITIVSASGNSYANYAAPGSATPGAYSTLTVANTWEDDGRGDRFGGLSGGYGDRYFAYEQDAAADRFAATSQRSTLGNQVAAPGSTIYSSWNGDQGKLYNTISGTSMASPLVAGMVALMQDAAFTYGGVYLSPAQVRQIIRASADDITDANVSTNGRAEVTFDSQGRAMVGPALNLPETELTYKRVNVYRAIQQVRATVTGQPVPDPNPVADDINNTIATAIELPSLDGTRSYEFVGNIGTDGAVMPGMNDVDVFKIVLESPGIVTFQTAAVMGGTNFDAYLRLFNSAGAQLAFSDDAGGSLYPRLESIRLQPGTYYFGVTSYNNSAYNVVTGAGNTNGQSAGDYNLVVSLSNPDPNGAFQGAVAVDSLGAFFNGLIGADMGLSVGSQDVDFFDVVAPDNGTLIIDIDTTPYRMNNTAVDTFIRVFDGNAVQIAEHDDEMFPDNLDSYLELSVLRGQRLYIAVADYSNRNFNPADPFDRSAAGPGGFYDLYLRFRNGDTNGVLTSAVVGTIGTPIAAVIGSDGGPTIGFDGAKDVDFYRLTASSTGLLDVSAVSMDNSLSAVVSLWTYNTTTGEATRIPDGSGSAARHIFRVTSGQTYYIAVTGVGNNDFNWFAPWDGSGGDTGSYVLNTAMRSLSDLASLADNAVAGATPTTLVLGQAIDAAIGRDGSLIQDATDIDLYRFVPSTSGRYQFRTDAAAAADAGNQMADTFLRIFDAAGNEIAFNDDAYIGTTGSFARVNLTGGQTYYIGVSGASATPRGYNPISGAGAAAGSSGLYILTGSVATELRAAANGTGTPIAGAVAGSARDQFTHTFAGVNRDGDPVLFQQIPGLSWRAVDLQAATNSPQITSNVVTWVDRKDGLTYAAANSAGGLLLFTNRAGQWTLRNLSTEMTGVGTITSEVSAFTETTGIVNIAGLNAQGQLLLFTQSGTGSSGAYAWAFANLTTRDLVPQGQSMPAFVGGRITSYVTSWNGLNIAGLTAAGEIHTVWWAPGLSLWQTTNLSAVTGAGQLSGGLTVYLTPWGGINLAGINSQGKASVTWWVPGFGGDWRNNNLTDETGGPTLDPNSITSYVTAWGALNIAGLNAQGKVVIYWWVPGFERWAISSISDEVPGSVLPAGGGRLTGVTGDGFDGTLNILGAAPDGDIVRYWWRPGGAWQQDNLSEIAVPA